METRPFRDPALPHILRDQRRAGQEAAQMGRAAVAGASAAGALGRTRPRDLAAEQRCAEVFGLRGGELCGCHTPGCDTCASNSGCGNDGCLPCQVYGYMAPTKRQGGPKLAWLGPKPVAAWKLPPVKPPAGHPSPFPIMAPEDTWDFPLAVRLRHLTAGAVGEYSAEVSLPATQFDAHAHNLATLDTTEQAARIERLIGMERPMFLFGSKDYNVPDGDKVNTGDDINEITQDAALDHPDVLFPFCKVLPEELETEGAATMVEKWLDAGFVGVGELTVHGHNENLKYANTDPEYEYFLEIFRTAFDWGVPVAVHWDLGSTDPGTDAEAANAQEFLDLLATLDGEGKAPTIILCHCGVGPSLPDESDELVAYKANLELILAYENVYFDLAGMQVGFDSTDGSYKAPVQQLMDEFGNVTGLGQFLLDTIKEYFWRFMLGTDVDNGYDDDFVDDTAERYGVSTSNASWQNYEDFLRRETSTSEILNEEEKKLVRMENAKGLLRA